MHASPMYDTMDVRLMIIMLNLYCILKDARIVCCCSQHRRHFMNARVSPPVIEIREPSNGTTWLTIKSLCYLITLNDVIYAHVH